MGRGRSKIGIAERRQLQKDLSAARRNETRLKNKFDLAMGATNIDMHAPDAQERFNSRWAAAMRAREQYEQAVEKREALERKIERSRPRRSSGPLF